MQLLALRRRLVVQCIALPLLRYILTFGCSAATDCIFRTQADEIQVEEAVECDYVAARCRHDLELDAQTLTVMKSERAATISCSFHPCGWLEQAGAVRTFSPLS